MAESKYGKYIVKQLKQSIQEASWTNPVQAAGKNQGGRLLWLDKEVVPGAFYVETVWAPAMGVIENPKNVAEAHSHDYDEALGLFGTDMSDPYQLNAEVEFWLGDEKHIITESCIIFIPKGLSHCPLVYHRVDKPVFLFTTHQGDMYV
jgi:hypothetical protein